MPFVLSQRKIIAEANTTSTQAPTINRNEISDGKRI